MIEISWRPTPEFHETLRRHLVDRAARTVKRAILIGLNAHYDYINDWNRQPNIRGVFQTEFYAANGQLLVEDVADSWWWLVNDGGSTMPKGGGLLYPVRAKKMQLAKYDAKTDGGDGTRSDLTYRSVVFGPRVVAARNMLGIVEEKVTPIIINMVRREL